MDQNQNTLLTAYRKMAMIRAFEERMHLEATRGEVPGFVHLYAGQEASAVGVCMNLLDGDVLLNTHRAHGPAIARDADIHAVAKEIYCRGDGLCRGRGGSAHLHDVKSGLWGANSGVGSGVALGLGAALAARNLRTGAVAVALVGDGAMNQGVVSEAMNMAAIWKLALVIVVENNGYGEATAAGYAIAGADIVKRAEGFAIPAVSVDGADYFAVSGAAADAIERARAGGGPGLIETRVPRFFGHFEGDAQTYRASGEVADMRQNADCLTGFRARVVGDGRLGAAQLDAVDGEVAGLIEDVFTQAIAASLPDEDELMRFVLADGN